jgi:NAD-dependent histone deacetylase SIR2
VKPNVVFFGEKMPEDFKRESTSLALANVDLLLIIGTTLKVKPFGYLPYSVKEGIP